MPQHANRGSWTKADPRAIAAGRKGGKKNAGKAWRSADYIKGYRAGARNARTHFERWMNERAAAHAKEAA
jgi:hypothetical protein